MYLCRELTDMSLPKIGQQFGGRDHTTVMHADKKIRQLMAERRADLQPGHRADEPDQAAVALTPSGLSTVRPHPSVAPLSKHRAAGGVPATRHDPCAPARHGSASTRCAQACGQLRTETPRVTRVGTPLVHSPCGRLWRSSRVEVDRRGPRWTPCGRHPVVHSRGRCHAVVHVSSTRREPSRPASTSFGPQDPQHRRRRRDPRTRSSPEHDRDAHPKAPTNNRQRAPIRSRRAGAAPRRRALVS